MVSSPDLIAFAVALMGSLLLTVPVRRLALHIGMVDLPGPRKVHLSPIPLLGGIAIYLGFLIAILLTMRGAPRAQMAGILAGATLVAAVGLLDDGKLLHHQIKLFAGMPIAAVLLIVSGIRAQIFSEFIPGAGGVALDVALTLLWVVGITASFSIFDHMDGLCAGVAAIAAGFFAVSATLNGQTMVRTLAAAAFGAALGFLIWNFNPAKIFMGDGGAMLLGFLMATLGLKIRPEGAAHFPAAWLVPVLILGATIFDTTLVSISRSRRGLIPFTTPGTDHAAHRLSNLGLGHRGAVVVLYALSGVLGTLALLVPRLSPARAYTLAAALAFAGLIAVALLERAPYERQVRRPSNPPPPADH